MYLLDTNVCIEIINGRPPRVRGRFDAAAQSGASLFVSTVTAFELSYGAEKSDRRDFNRRRLQSFFSGPIETLTYDKDDADQAGSIRAELEKKGTPIGPFDTLIAGLAMQRKLTVVTANTREFSRVKGLTVENWSR